jgi:hypothetical protein
MPVFTPELNSMRTLWDSYDHLNKSQISYAYQHQVVVPGFELLDVFGPMEILTVV